MDVAHVVRVLEPVQGALVVAKPDMNERERVRRHVTLLGNGVQGVQDLLGLIPPAGLRENVAAERQHLAIASR